MLALRRVPKWKLRYADVLSERYANGVRSATLHRCFSTRKMPEVDPRVAALRDKLIYCDHLDRMKLKMTYMDYWVQQKTNAETARLENIRRQLNSDVFSVGVLEEEDNSNRDDQVAEEDKPVHMPYNQPQKIQNQELAGEDPPKDSTSSLSALNKTYKDLYEEYLRRQEAELKDMIKSAQDTESSRRSVWIRPKDDLSKVPPDWMTDFEQFDDARLAEVPSHAYGTPNPSVGVSGIPCGGCGALLHCRNPAIPGYLPSELFSPASVEDLKLMHCQRCHFLKHYNTALDVQVSPDEYPELLKVIKKKLCAVILMVDLTDFPCSIWPNVADVLNRLTPIFLVGNKVDLLPPDSGNFFAHVTDYLRDYVQRYTSIRPEMIMDTQLISAQTGYGVEALINKLQRRWKYKGDVYLIGCTNVGKSSLFNALIQSDYCKAQASDLIQRATISAWPGTTINLLKFPIMNPTPKKLTLRWERLKEMQQIQRAENQHKTTMFKATGALKYATLTGFVDRTFTGNSFNPSEDPFSEKSHKHCSRKFGLDETRPEYAQSKWCYDTPGTVQPDQVIDLLTTDELLLTLPDRMISPRSFDLKVNQTVFVAGLGRLDFLEGDRHIRCTLFASHGLPITICRTEDATDLYKALLETEAFKVPTNEPKRLEVWPGLAPKDFSFIGSSRFESTADIVLSSIGWIAITAEGQRLITLRAWTPQGRGLHMRNPALLKNSVSLRGKRVPGTQLYRRGRQIRVVQ